MVMGASSFQGLGGRTAEAVVVVAHGLQHRRRQRSGSAARGGRMFAGSRWMIWVTVVALALAVVLLLLTWRPLSGAFP